MDYKNLDIVIKKASKENIDDILSIEAEAYGNHRWSRESFLGEFENNLAKYYIILVNNELAGYLGTWFIIEEAHITTLAIKNKFRRNNLASLLLINFFEDCYREKIKYVMLEVRVSNKSAISLYEKFCFKCISVRKKYYQDNNEDAYIMFTENIFYNNFKNNYDKIKEKLKTVNVKRK